MESYKALDIKEIKEISNKTNTTSIVINTILFLAGLGLILFVNTSEQTSNLNIMRLSAAWALIIVAIIGLFAKRKHLVYAPTGSTVKKIDKTYYASDFETLKSTFKAATGGQDLPISGSESVNLVCLYSTDKHFATYQVCKYGLMETELLTNVNTLEGEKAETFINTIR